ncbi:serine/threonine protein kinase [Caulifigura coniformis]|uniref:serine/threonine protein kinase n=1 Tax=Caulifigura coniformis TaxID=2527983 RepID=UPI0018D22F9B|nr:serine/threonine-protein kinase [Caulifigura coniformis]
MKRFNQLLRLGEQPVLEEFVDELPSYCRKHRDAYVRALLTAEMSHLTLMAEGAFPTRHDVIQLHRGMADEITSSVYQAIRDDAEDAPLMLGRYQVEKTVSRGAQGWVAKAFPLPFGRPVALKIYHDSVPVTSIAVEAEALSVLSHDLIVRHIEFGESLGYHYLALEYCEYPRLSQTYSESTPSAADIYRISEQTCLAVQHCHERGVFHADLKPDNILASREGHFKLIDFGLSHVLQGLLSGTSKRCDYSGTFEYMPPEKAARREAIDLKSADLFGIGGIMLWLLTQEAPFAGHRLPGDRDENARRRAIEGGLHSDVVDLARKRLPGLADLTLRLLAKDPAGRPATLSEVLGELHSLRERECPQPRGPAGPTLPATVSRVDAPASGAAETRFRRLQLQTFRFTLSIATEDWNQIYRPIDEERRPLRRVSHVTKALKQGTPLIALEMGAVVLRAPIDCTFAARDQMEEQSFVILGIADSSVPSEIKQMIEHPEICSRMDFKVTLDQWISELESTVEQQLTELSARHDTSLRKYAAKAARRRAKFYHLQWFQRSRGTLRVVSTAILTFVVFIWLGLQVDIVDDPEQRRDVWQELSVAVMATLMLAAGLIYIGLGQLFQLYDDSRTYWPPRDHPFHRKESVDRRPK